MKIEERSYDVVVVGGGSAGVAAAIAARRNGANVLLVEMGPVLGGDLVSGLPIDGCLNARGEWIVGGVVRELFDAAKALGGFVQPLFDWRLIWAVCLEPDMLRLAIMRVLADYKVPLLLYSFVKDVVMDGERVTGIVVVNKSGTKIVRGEFFIDCSGDGDVACMAGAPFELGHKGKIFQPLSLVFWAGGIDFGRYLDFVRDNHEQYILGDSPVITISKAECARKIHDSGYPFAGLDAQAPMLKQAITDGRMNPCGALYVWPVSPALGMLGINTTRVADVDATDPDALSGAIEKLSSQVVQCMDFVHASLPGFEKARIAGMAPRVGVRETRRVMGEYVLNQDDVINGTKRADGIAKGGHHVDVHGSGTAQQRIPVRNGDSYDIPYGCLIPKGLTNVFIAGRCFSSTREAHGSARVMGQCMATGQAAATAAALACAGGIRNSREVDLAGLRRVLKEQGAVLDGTH